jgi:hypothetical protein
VAVAATENLQVPRYKYDTVSFPIVELSAAVYF